MEPSNMSHWSDTKFVIRARITFSIYKSHVSDVPMSEMLAAVVLADCESPWWQDGSAARLNVSQPELSMETEEVAIYVVTFQSACSLTPSQMPAYVKYTALLAENAHQFMSNPDAVHWIGSTVDFHGTSIIFDAKRSASV